MIYDIPDGQTEIENHAITPFLVITSESLSPDEVKKVQQIVSAIGIQSDKIDIQQFSSDDLTTYDNIFMKQNVTRALIFTNKKINQLEEYRYKMVSRAGTQLILAHSIQKLIEDEHAGIKERRMALWKAMKEWS